MDLLRTILKNKKYKKIIDSLSTETLEIIAKDHQRALIEARNGIQKEEPGKADDIDYLEVLATSMQRLAKQLLQRNVESPKN